MARTSARKARRGFSCRPLARRRPKPGEGKPGVADVRTEHAEQCAFFQRVRNFLPHLRRAIFAIPNGAARFGETAAKLVAEGMEPGVLDIFCAVPRAGFHGLFIETKRTHGGRVSDDQDETLRVFCALGYAVVVAPGADAAWSALLAYLELPTCPTD